MVARRAGSSFGSGYDNLVSLRDQSDGQLVYEPELLERWCGISLRIMCEHEYSGQVQQVWFGDGRHAYREQARITM